MYATYRRVVINKGVLGKDALYLKPFSKLGSKGAAGAARGAAGAAPNGTTPAAPGAAPAAAAEAPKAAPDLTTVWQEAKSQSDAAAMSAERVGASLPPLRAELAAFGQIQEATNQLSAVVEAQVGKGGTQAAADAISAAQANFKSVLNDVTTKNPTIKEFLPAQANALAEAEVTNTNDSLKAIRTLVGEVKPAIEGQVGAWTNKVETASRSAQYYSNVAESQGRIARATEALQTTRAELGSLTKVQAATTALQQAVTEGKLPAIADAQQKLVEAIDAAPSELVPAEVTNVATSSLKPEAYQAKEFTKAVEGAQTAVDGQVKLWGSKADTLSTEANSAINLSEAEARLAQAAAESTPLSQATAELARARSELGSLNEIQQATTQMKTAVREGNIDSLKAGQRSLEKLAGEVPGDLMPAEVRALISPPINFKTMNGPTAKVFGTKVAAAQQPVAERVGAWGTRVTTAEAKATSLGAPAAAEAAAAGAAPAAAEAAAPAAAEAAPAAAEAAAAADKQGFLVNALKSQAARAFPRQMPRLNAQLARAVKANNTEAILKLQKRLAFISQNSGLKSAQRQAEQAASRYQGALQKVLKDAGLPVTAPAEGAGAAASGAGAPATAADAGAQAAAEAKPLTLTEVNARLAAAGKQALSDQRTKAINELSDASTQASARVETLRSSGKALSDHLSSLETSVANETDAQAKAATLAEGMRTASPKADAAVKALNETADLAKAGKFGFLNKASGVIGRVPMLGGAAEVLGEASPFIMAYQGYHDAGKAWSNLKTHGFSLKTALSVVALGGDIAGMAPGMGAMFGAGVSMGANLAESAIK
jgi:hypothetical protein